MPVPMNALGTLKGEIEARAAVVGFGAAARCECRRAAASTQRHPSKAGQAIICNRDTAQAAA